MAFSGGDDVNYQEGQQSKADFNVKVLAPDTALALLKTQYQMLRKGLMA